VVIDAAAFAPGTGWLTSREKTLSNVLGAPGPIVPTVVRRDLFEYDAGGNLEFKSQAYRSTGSCSSQDKADADCEDAVSFYAADGKLRAAEHRTRLGSDNGNYWRDTFEEYRYDALGRRVWVRSRVVCPGGNPAGWPLVPCFSAVRRTVWDGDAELWEIQMPGQDGSPHLENDTQPIPVQSYIGWYPTGSTPPPNGWDANRYSAFDPNPRFGRVSYTHGLGVDQPLSVLRVGLNRYYADQFPGVGGQAASFAPFAAAPFGPP